MVIGVALTVLALDVVSKMIVVRALPKRPPIRLLDGFLTLRLLRNSGAAFSIGTSMTIVFTVIAAAVIVYILRAARKLRSAAWAITLGLLLGGATGNLSDRIFRAPGLFRGDVVDWIELPHWPVFNLADSAIVCGGVLAVLLALLGRHMDGTRDGSAAADAEADAGAGTGSGPEASGGAGPGRGPETGGAKTSGGMEISAGPEISGRPETSGGAEISGRPETSGGAEISGRAETSGGAETSRGLETSGQMGISGASEYSGSTEAGDDGAGSALSAGS